MPAGESNPDRLDGWKAIAAYLNRAERTVIRWEKLGLPVRRLRIAKGESVFAFKSEIEEWLRRSPPANHAEGNHEADEPATAAASSAATPAGDGPLPGETASTAPPASRRARVVIVLSGAAGVALLTTVFWWPPGSANPHAWRMEEDALIVLNESGWRLWSHRLDTRPNLAEYRKPVEAPDRHLVTIADLDGDGTNEVLFRFYGAQNREAVLHCFGADGRTRFTYEYAGTVVYGDGPSEPPFPITRVLVDRTGPEPAIVAVAQHGLWFPSRVVRLDARGRELQAYWSNGHLNRIAPGRLDGDRVLFVGGEHNETKWASLAVLGTAGETAAPAETERYRCLSCRGDAPLAFLLFPPSLLTEAVGVRPRVVDVVSEPDGGVRVTVQHYEGENLPGDTVSVAAHVYYKLDVGLRLQGVVVGNDFVRTRARAGFIGLYSPDQDDDRRFSDVRVWNGGRFGPIELAPAQGAVHARPPAQDPLLARK